MRTLVLVASLALLTLAGLSARLHASAPPPPVYRIIVHPDNGATVLDRRLLEDAFLKKIKTWPNGETIRPADLSLGSPVRRRFSEEILQRPVAAVRAYWQQSIFSGRNVPPPELDSDEEVVSYVMKYAGAVGYVSGSASLNGPRVIAVR
jgi:ABC-type phosphate transport system substrate-binding protein